MLSAGAFNALLKTLEEPPEHVLFILATTETHKVPATIVSRCQRFAFRRINKEDISKRLFHICEKEDISIEKDAIELLTQMADGSLRDALSLLDQCAENTAANLTEGSVRETLGLSGLGELAAWLGEMDDLQKSMGRFDAFYQAGMDVSAILGQLSALLRDLLMGQMLGDLSVTRLPAKEAEELSALWPRERLLRALEQFADTRLSRSGNKKLEAELCLIRLAGPAEAAAIPIVKQTVIKAAEPPKQAKEPPKPPPEPQAEPEKPPPEPEGNLIDAARDPRWAELMNTIGNPLLKDALSKSGAKVDGDRLVLQNVDSYIQGVLQNADKEIRKLFPGGIQKSQAKANNALDALIASAGDLVIEEKEE
jgi:DNA polymerase-3 subunit gamma/tau